MLEIFGLFVSFLGFLVTLYIAWRVLSRLEAIEDLLRNIDKNFVEAATEARKSRS